MGMEWNKCSDGVVLDKIKLFWTYAFFIGAKEKGLLSQTSKFWTYVLFMEAQFFMLRSINLYSINYLETILVGEKIIIDFSTILDVNHNKYSLK